MTAQVTRTSGLAMQVCVPDFWHDDAAQLFAEQQNPCGTTAGWQIRRQGSKQLAGADERVPCREREGHVHIMLDA